MKLKVIFIIVITSVPNDPKQASIGQIARPSIRHNGQGVRTASEDQISANADVNGYTCSVDDGRPESKAMNMRRTVPLLVGLLLGHLGCKNDTTIVKGQPELVLSVDNVDFGEVILGYQSTIGFYATNDGMGELTVSELGLTSDSSYDFHLLSDDIEIIDPGESAELMIRYVPAEVGQDFGTLVLVSDDEEIPEASVVLEAFGVEPLVDVEPSILWYGTLAQGESQTQRFQVSARGSGSLKITDIGFAADEGEAFAYTLPDGVELPYEMASGLSLSVDVTFTAIDDRTWDGSLLLQTNDPTTPQASIQLLAN